MMKSGHTLVILILVMSGFIGIISITPEYTSAYTPHDPIFIEGDEDFAAQAASEGWSGDGTERDPYVIEGYEIIVEYRNNIEVKSTTVSFMIRDSHLQMGPYSIYLDGVSNCRIYNCTLEQNGYGIYLNSTNNIIITNNNLLHNAEGIYLRYSSGNSIMNNTISSYYNNINLYYSSSINIANNTMMGGSIFITGDMLVNWNTHDIDTSNTVNGKPVYYLKNQISGTVPLGAGQVILANCTNIIIENQEITNGSVGIKLGFCTNNSIVGNNVHPKNEYGIYLFNSSGNEIRENAVSSEGSNILGITLYYSNENIISANNVSNNWDGIGLWNSNNNIITGNNAFTNNNSGISIGYSVGNSIISNLMTGNGLFISGDQIDHWTTHDIDTSNTVNDKPLYYLKNQEGGTVPSGAGQVILANCSDILIENQVITKGSVGIELGFSSNNRIYNNILRSTNEYGIYLRNSTGNDIKNNNVSLNGQYGIYLSHSSSNIIQDNGISSNRYNGINLDFSYENNILGNNISSTDDYGIDLFLSDKNKISENNISSIRLSGIHLQSSDNNELIFNNATMNGWYGIDLDYSNSNYIEDNILSNNDDGGISLRGSENNTFSNNTIIEGDWGFYLWSSNNNHILTNLATNNRDGIQLSKSNENYIRGNTFDRGVKLGDSNWNTIIYNNISSSWSAMIITGSNNNTIHHNNINTYMEPIYFTNSTNVWDDGNGEGNYWSDYSGLDDGSNGRTAGDGVGDTNLPHQGVDYYPLMESVDIEDFNEEEDEEFHLFSEVWFIVLILLTIITVVVILAFMLLKKRKPSEISSDAHLQENLNQLQDEKSNQNSHNQPKF